jgi:anti-anti-sigma factor
MCYKIAMPMNVQATGMTAAVLLRVIGRVDGETAPMLEQECDQRIKPGLGRMILDLSGVEYISSAGLGSVLITGKKLDAGGGELVLSGLPPKIRHIFKFTGFENLFKMFETADAAVLYCESEAGARR